MSFRISGMEETIGGRIKELRKKKGLTQRQLADDVGIHFTYLSKIENGNTQYSPSTSTLKRLATKLGADELELLRLADKLPEHVEKIAHTEQGLSFLRRAANFKSPEEWEELMAFLEKQEKKAQRLSANPPKQRKTRKG
jgi:HTH-type transcriptional regulator, competence development regulator